MNVEKLPERVRKAILWSVVIALGAALLVWLGKDALEKFQGFSTLRIPEGLEQDIRETTEGFEFPSVDLKVPSDIEEQLQTIQELQNGQPEGQ
ncbi:MAG: hypothetical protein Q8P12_01135 [bacterium]|nr:hypothetical protein [bacterium]